MTGCYKMKKTIYLKMIFCLLYTVLAVGAIGNAQDAEVDVEGTWKLSIEFISGSAIHTAVIIQEGKKLTGTYKGEIKEGTLSGSVDGEKVVFSGSIRHEATGVRFSYSGTVDGDTMKGTVDMGEYWTATFTGKRIADDEGKER